jgi:hypothetical protein
VIGNRTVETVVREGIVEVLVTGTIRFKESYEILQGALTLARDNRTGKLLFDIRTATHPEFHSLIMKMAGLFSFLVPLQYTFAIVDLPDSEMLRFVEDVGRNRGFRVCGFASLEDARAWLHALSSNQPASRVGKTG